MARKAREKSKTGIYNIILKSSEVLFKTKEDYDFFVEIMKDYINELYAYALHLHMYVLLQRKVKKALVLI